MRIDSAAIGMESARSYQAQTKQSFNFFTVAGQLTQTGFDFGNMLPDQSGEQEDTAEKENEGLNAGGRLEDFRTQMNGFSSQRLSGRAMVLGTNRDMNSQMRSIRQQCIDFLFQLLFRGKGKKIGNFGTENNNLLKPLNIEPVPIPSANNFLIAGVQRKIEYSESESTTFTTQGLVKTADGREIEFNLNLIMTREFKAVYEETFIQVVQNFKDPLVINLDTFTAEMTDQTFVFDIEGNGEKSTIPILSNKSGYLAWDKYDDGVVRCGKQLFGTASGNGFKDLALHDLDGNGWIDEADEIWSKLMIWIMETDGSSTLYSLADKGVGAIYLGNLSTDFTLTNQVNEAQAKIRSTGLFLYESGAVGSVQQVDVVKFEA
ncbi:MAG: hypothetical protein FWC09_04300 [Lachnospiraceae bacterium]|nr:hypothetical protein [Lachnospiraceae bacterium]